MRRLLSAAAVVAALAVASVSVAEPAAALAPTPAAAAPAPGYGAPVSLERAKRIVAAAEAEARRQGYLMAFAVVEPSGSLVAFARMDGTQYGSIEVSQAKARSAALFRRPSKAFSDSVAAGHVGVLALQGAIPVEGGIPIVVDGRIVGAVGVSGGSSDQDGAVAAAALAATR
jgi:glc operon protein GlcG